MSGRLATRSFIAKSSVSQLLSVAACVTTWSVFPNIALAIGVACIAAYLGSMIAELPTAWRIVNVSLPITSATTLALSIPGYLYLIPLILILAIYSPAILNRVPYYPTQKPAYALILAELPRDRPFEFVDLGCGFGDLLFFLAKHRPNGRFVGVELGPLPCLVARIKALFKGLSNVSVRFRDMWRYDLRDSDFVYTFLSPAAMEDVWAKVSRDMRSGSTFITNSFPVPAPANEEISVHDDRGSKLYLHRMAREAN